MKHNTYRNEKLKMIRERYSLDEIVKDGKDELEKLLRLGNWIHSLKLTQDLSRHYTHWTPNNPVWELDFFTRRFGHMDRPYGWFCHDFNHAYAGCCQALGYVARPIIMASMNPPTGSGHCFPEVWSNQYNKWVYIDAYNNNYYQRDDGMLINTKEVHEAQFDPLLFKRISQIRANRDFAPEQILWGGKKQPDVMACPKGYESMGIWPRNNFMDEPFPCAIWDGVYQFSWDGRLWFQDPRVRFIPEFSRYTQRWDDMYFGINQCFIQPEFRGNGLIHVFLSHNMPHFKCYKVRFNGKGEWKEYTGDFLWNLESGENSLEIHPVNLYGIPGVLSSITISY